MDDNLVRDSSVSQTLERDLKFLLIDDETGRIVNLPFCADRGISTPHQAGVGPSVPAAAKEEIQNPTTSSPPSTPIILPVIQ